MTTLLRVDASARHARSLTRDLADRFIAAWLEARPDDRVISRDLALSPPPFVSEEWIAAAFAKGGRTPKQMSVLSVSDTLIAELEAAEIYVIAAPMYNYGMPAALKAWFDQVIRLDRTFTFDLGRGDHPLEPVLLGKRLVLLTASGEFGWEPGGLNDGRGHLVPHIRTAAFYLGVEDRFDHIGIEYQEFGDARHDASRAAAQAAIGPLVDRLVSSQAPTTLAT